MQMHLPRASCRRHVSGRLIGFAALIAGCLVVDRPLVFAELEGFVAEPLPALRKSLLARRQSILADSNRHKKKFELLDSDSNGQITKVEMLEGFSRLEDPLKQLSANEVNSIFDLIDENCDGVVDRNEFCLWFDRLRCEYAAFKAADTNGDGKIEMEEFHDIAWGFSEFDVPMLDGDFQDVDPVPDERLQGADPEAYVKRGCGLKFRQIDLDGDGYISFTEYLTSLNFYKHRNVYLLDYKHADREV